ncbi:MAG: phytochelatin synthase family protein [Pseudomonadota bacterium]
MITKTFKYFSVAALMSAALMSSAFSANLDEAVINKSMSFHYSEYPQSPYSKQVAVTNWNSKEGIERFSRTEYKGDFFRLAHHFAPQPNPAACGQAAATVVLSAIYELNHQPMPVVEEWPIAIGDKKYPLQYRIFNEGNFFSEATDKILDHKAIYMKMTRKDGSFGGGIDIDELQKMLKIHGVKSKLVYADKYDDKVLADFRTLVKEVINSDQKFLLLNYDHSYKGLMGGHFSPIAAYDEKSDSVLMLDVAAHRNQWIWINLSDLYHAMNTKNYVGSNYRGYLVVDTKLNK